MVLIFILTKTAISQTEKLMNRALVTPILDLRCFKNLHELFNLKDLKILMLYEKHIFQCMGKIFWVEFHMYT